jgi:hypothetical protein
MPKGEWYVWPSSPVTLRHPRSISKLLPGLEPDDLLVVLLAADIIQVKKDAFIFSGNKGPASGRNQLEMKGAQHCVFANKQFPFPPDDKIRRSYWVLYPGLKAKPNLEDATYRNGIPKPRKLELPSNKTADIQNLRNKYFFALTDQQENAIKLCIEQSGIRQPKLTINTAVSFVQPAIITPDASSSVGRTESTDQLINTEAVEAVVLPQPAIIPLDVPAAEGSNANGFGTSTEDWPGVVERTQGMVEAPLVADNAPPHQIIPPSQRQGPWPGVTSVNTGPTTIPESGYRQGATETTTPKSGYHEGDEEERPFYSFDKTVELANSLDFDTSPRVARDGETIIEITESKQFSQAMKRDVAYYFTLVTEKLPSLSSKNEKKLREALLRIVAYDYGFKYPVGGTVVKEWISKFRESLQGGVPLPNILAGKTMGRPKGFKLWEKLDRDHPMYIRELYRAAVRKLTGQAPWDQIAAKMSDLSADAEHNKGRPTITLSGFQLSDWFHSFGGKEKAVVPRPLLTDEKKTRRVEWCLQRLREIERGERFVFLDEKWFYVRSRRKKVKVLPWIEGEDIKYATPAPIRNVNRRHATKIMYMGVVAAPVREHDFNGKIALVRVSKTAFYSK